MFELRETEQEILHRACRRMQESMNAVFVLMQYFDPEDEDEFYRVTMIVCEARDVLERTCKRRGVKRDVEGWGKRTEERQKIAISN